MAGERILVVDDEPGVRSALENILLDEGFHVASVASGEEGLERLLASEFDAVFLDVWLPGIDGIETLRQLQERNVGAEVVMISGHGTIETAVLATRLGAFDFVEKPLSLEKTLLVLRNALRQRFLERSNRRLVERLSRDTEIVGASPAAKRLKSQVAAAVSSDGPVLILGEQGSGRETVARRIHSLGERSEEAYLDVPCASMDENAAAAALFGSEAGPSRLTLASLGSVYLHNVHSLSGGLQRRLADFLESRDFLEMNVRVLASAEIGAGDLAGPLRRRLEVLRCDTPPLRQRREDIVPLAERFMVELAKEYGRAPKRFTPECASALVSYDWPGNTAQLRNLVERLLLTSGQADIGEEDLPEELGGPARHVLDLYGDLGTLDEAMAAFERYYIRRALESHGRDAAVILGLKSGALQERIRYLGID
jgi:two-component system nitrogen regulation response regulator NtrX